LEKLIFKSKDFPKGEGKISMRREKGGGWEEVFWSTEKY
jgi:hypothetical protein